MARIRSIKPEFFDDEDLCELPPLHRLCYIGLWCQADKAGRLEDRPKRLRARVLPFDDVDMEAMLTDLTQAGFIIRYVVDRKQYIAIKPSAWAKHQRPRSDEPESELPSVDSATVFVSSLHSDEDEPSETLGKEGNGKEVEREGSGADAAPPAADGVDLVHECVADLADAWNRLTEPPIPRCRDLTAKRKRHARARLNEHPLMEWEEIFGRIQASAFCRGTNDRGWVASFDWAITSPDVAVKVLEGKYDDRQTTTARRSTPPQAATTASDWRDECAAFHGGVCDRRYVHEDRMKVERATV